MTFGQFLSIIRARWRLVVSVFFGIVAFVVILSLVLPKQYIGIASVVVDLKPDPLSAALYGVAASPAIMATQVDIIQSDRVALRVVRDLKLSQNPEIRQQWLDDTNGVGDIETWLIELLQKKLDVKPSKESNVISVSYKAPDPVFAAGLANAFVKAYLTTALELRVDPAKGYSAFFDEQAKTARQALEKSQEKLSAFQKANEIVASDERIDVESARLSDLSTQLVGLQAITAESSSRQGLANSASGDRIQDVLNSPLISSLKADVGRAEARLKELNTRLGDRNPQVLEAQASLGELRSRLDSEIRKITGGVTVANTINRQREAEVRAALEAQRGKVLRLKQIRDEGNVLVRDVENAKAAYDAVLGRLTQTTLESHTTQTNVTTLTQAVPPIEESSPRLILNTIVSIFLGGLIASGLAVLKERKDRRVRTAEDVVAIMGLPLLGVLPDPNAKARRGANRIPNMQQRLLAPLPSPTKGV